MDSAEKMVIDTLVSMSKSLSKIAVELEMIRTSLNNENKAKLKESRRLQLNGRAMLSENMNTPVNKPKIKVVRPSIEQVRAIRQGELIN